jgi:hypothetical protein
MISNTALSKRDLLLLAFIFLVEISLVVTLKALHMKGDSPFDVFILTKPGLVFLCAAIVFLIAGVGIFNLHLANRHSPSRYFRLIVGMNVVTVLVILVIGEMAVRAGVRSHLDGEAFGKVALVPKNWKMTKDRYRNLLEKADGDLSYLVYDERMGWSVGPRRHSANGLYHSSEEGLRSQHEGGSFTMAQGKTSIALIGDSYTFGEEVRYEESWGYYLGQMLGDGVQILNFGVPGYGLDQAYLRYEKDAKRWKAKVAIFGLFSHDFQRTMTVYPFLAHPRWEMPFSKPRFIVHGDDVDILNQPALRPEATFSHDSIQRLPFLDRDYGYKWDEWQTRFYNSSYLFRLFVSLFPRSSSGTPDVSLEEVVSINASILKRFVKSAAEEGTIPVMVYFPGRMELRRSNSPPAFVKSTLQDLSMGYVDPTPCLLQLNPRDRFMPGGHYTPAGNAAVAKCLSPAVQQALRQAAFGQQTARAEFSSSPN